MEVKKESGVDGIAYERRTAERRETTIAAYLKGGLAPRRRAGRRSTDMYPIVDWHAPRVLIPVLAILGLCVLDGIFTVMLMSHGAAELNPVMALLLPHKLGWFAAIKLSLTGMGVCVLVACSRMRLFRTVPGEALLYAVLLGYLMLITYELELLQLVPQPDA